PVGRRAPVDADRVAGLELQPGYVTEGSVLLALAHLVVGGAAGGHAGPAETTRHRRPQHHPPAHRSLLPKAFLNPRHPAATAGRLHGPAPTARPQARTRSATSSSARRASSQARRTCSSWAAGTWASA